MPGTAGPRAYAACLCLTLAASMANALAQAPFPTRSIRIVIPTAPGGGNDLVGRMLAQGLAERFGVTVVPENRTGAGTVIGNDIVAKSKPDGYTLLMAAG